MGVATGCGFKEIYRFPHTTYSYSSCICTFLQQHPYFFVHFLYRYIASASARGRELSGRVRADAYNFAVLCSGPAPCV